MEELKECVTEEEAPAADPHDEQKSPLHRRQPEESERHLVAERPKSECWFISDSEESVNLHLRAMFTVLLTFAVIFVLMTEYSFNESFTLFVNNRNFGVEWWHRREQDKWTRFTFFVKLGAIVIICVLVRTWTKNSRQRRKAEEKRPISVVLQV